MSIYWTPFPGDPEDHKLRGRSYRSEADILSLILRILEAMDGRPLRKTRLIQYANLNTKSFSKYIDILEKEGLVALEPQGYVITGRGKLALRVLDLLSSLITPTDEDEDLARVAGLICPAALELGLRCLKNTGLYDKVVEHEGGLLGIHVSSCKGPSDPLLISAILKAYSSEDTLTLILCTSSKLTGAQNVSADTIIYYTTPSKDDVKNALRHALKMAG